MKITDVKIPDNEENLGLVKINMYRLEKLVVIAGKNGAGKSRLLELVSSKFTKKPSLTRKAAINEEIKYENSNIAMMIDYGTNKAHDEVDESRIAAKRLKIDKYN